MVLDIYVPPGSVDTYTITFLTSSTVGNEGKLTICDARVVTAGWNLPCVDDNQMDHVLSSEDLNITFNRAVIEVGWLGNAADTGAMSDPDNKVSLSHDPVSSMFPV